MNVDLLLLLVIGAVFVLGIVILLQSARGRAGLASAALRLAEALIAYAVRWLERNLPGDVVDVPTIAGESKRIDTLAKAKLALDWLRYPSA